MTTIIRCRIESKVQYVRTIKTLTAAVRLRIGLIFQHKAHNELSSDLSNEERNVAGPVKSIGETYEASAHMLILVFPLDFYFP